MNLRRKKNKNFHKSIKDKEWLIRTYSGHSSARIK